MRIRKTLVWSQHIAVGEVAFESCARPAMKPISFYQSEVERKKRLTRGLCSLVWNRPEFPARGFESIDQARLWGSDFVRWYNTEHRPSGIRYVTPEQRHAGDDEALLAARHLLYQAARAKNPARWSQQTRNWSPIVAVTLNPERDGVVAAVATTSRSMPLAAWTQATTILTFTGFRSFRVERAIKGRRARRANE